METSAYFFTSSVLFLFITFRWSDRTGWDSLFKVILVVMAFAGLLFGLGHLPSK